KIFLWHEAHPSLPCRHTAIEGVVPVVTHHEIVTFRHIERLGVVDVSLALSVQHVVFDAVRKRFLEARLGRALLWASVFAHWHLWCRLAVDVDDAVTY